MKKILFAAVTAGVLSLSFAPIQADAAQVRVGIGPNGVGIGIRDGHRGWHRHGPRCRMVKTWRHHRPVWVKRCW